MYSYSLVCLETELLLLPIEGSAQQVILSFFFYNTFLTEPEHETSSIFKLQLEQISMSFHLACQIWFWGKKQRKERERASLEANIGLRAATNAAGIPAELALCMCAFFAFCLGEKFRGKRLESDMIVWPDASFSAGKKKPFCPSLSPLFYESSQNNNFSLSSKFWQKINLS